jgi:ParB family chromosome partitioning protein
VKQHDMATTGQKRPRLGRGLDAMLPAAPSPAARDAFSAAIEDVHPNRDQPRKRFDEEKLEELARSIRELGVLEPVLVRKRAAGGFEIIAGERRWRAAMRAGLKEVPVFVRELSAEEAFEAALVENLQREDLNPIETGRAFARLIEEHGHTQESVAARVGKDRSTVANAMRLLKLPDDVLAMVEDGRLSEGHGRAILGAPTVAGMQKLARDSAANGLSVRETEKRARALAREGGKRPAPPTRSANVKDLESRLSRALGARVSVTDKKGKGTIAIAYASYDELDRLLAKLV